MDLDEILKDGIEYYWEENYEQAIECFNQIISLNPNYAKAYHYRALVRRRQRDDKGAREDLVQAASLLGDREYTAMSQKMLKLIGCDYRHESPPREDDFDLIFYEDNWYTDYDELSAVFPEHFLPDWEYEEMISEGIAYAGEELERLERWLFKKLERACYIHKKRAINAEFDEKRLRENNLPLCNSHEEIAAAIGISIAGLRWLAYSQKKYHYTHFKIPKKTGGERNISAPIPLLKKAQNWILNNILTKIQPHNAAHGFCNQRSIVTNAQPHLGKEVIINIDLKDFFPSISYKRVKGVFQSFGYSKTASIIFGLICTAPKLKEIEWEGKPHHLLSWTERYLPQGSPSSPAISNLICRRLDSRLTEMAVKYGFNYTRYADDLTFSASGDSLKHISHILKDTRLIVRLQDFEINENKTRIMRKSRRQEVTGIVVNSELNISRETLKRFRATLYNLEKDGLENRHWGNSQGGDLIASIEGFANFVCMVNPEKGAKFQQQVTRIKEKYRPKKTQNSLAPQLITKSDIIALINDDIRKLHWSNRDRRIYLRQVYGKQSLQQFTVEELLKVQNHFCCFLDALSQKNTEVARLGWSGLREQNYLEDTYYKYSPEDLTYQELLEFLEYLKSQPSP
ncbi:MAG: reverse transcriptase domain-containing protein [Cyanobacteriota bacterium]|nr:reverse transcriptase domain-containing protein [Cyanobacteriota bacterium]